MVMKFPEVESWGDSGRWVVREGGKWVTGKGGSLGRCVVRDRGGGSQGAGFAKASRT